ncbi:hypothetical protein AVEN_193542-1 [Araneus ventricosus]|uniref:Uncharacterized protein n=1 Tax=Araneus ventricosus TaxID=182803 RepID=A0A4Y2VCM5_ARAVE|nr:hypothetical protein AVEN_193542-1 [Araneus ventricosus]
MNSLLTSFAKISSVKNVELVSSSEDFSETKDFSYSLRPSLKGRARHIKSELVKDLKRDDFDHLLRELRYDGSLNNFLKMASFDFEHFIVTLGHNIAKKLPTTYSYIMLLSKRRFVH